MDYKELDVWKETRKLVFVIYKNTRNFPFDENYGLMSQLRRAAVSVVSNIAEGCGRNSSLDTKRFLYMARGSLNELETQLYLSFDLDFIDEKILNELLKRTVRCKRLLNGFIKYLRKREKA